MCALCRKNPCDFRCPNAPDPEPIHECVLCGEGIFSGDRYWESPEGPICNNCLGEMNGREVLEKIGEDMKEAREEEW